MDSGRISHSRTFEPYLQINDNETMMDHKEEIVTLYVESGKNNLAQFLETKNIQPEKLESEVISNAKPLSSGISGALKGELEGETVVIKPQVLSRDFKDNLEALINKGMKIEHKLVSESDDPYTDFPRKEVLGVTLAQAFGLSTPETKLVVIKEHEFASVQKFQHTATPMSKHSDLSPVDLDLHSVKRTFFLHLVTENIDGHSGNIMLNPFTAVGDSLASFIVIPIDYGLIFPRHDSIYPKETNLFKKGFFEFIQSRTINTRSDLKTLVDELVPQKEKFHALMKDHEIRLFENNFKALEIMSKEDSKMKIYEFLDIFIQTVLTLNKK